MFCSNCGAQLPENGICQKCGVPAQNMTFNGHMQGQPVTPQQQFYNPNPMYVQYQGPQMGYGQPYVPQNNVAIKGIKEPRMVAGIAATIKNCCGSMMMVILALLATLAAIFSFVELGFVTERSIYDIDSNALGAAMIFWVRCVPFILFAIGAWMITFQGFAGYNRRLYNDNACMHTSGFSTVQAGAITALIPTVVIAIMMVFISFFALIYGVTYMGSKETSSRGVVGIMLYVLFVTVMLVLMIVVEACIINQMAKIKHAIRGRNYESISILCSVLLFIMAIFQVVLLVFYAIDEEVVGILISGVYALWYAFAGCSFMFIRSKVNSFILGH